MIATLIKNHDQIKSIEMENTIKEAKRYLSEEGYVSGTNFTVDSIAYLMVEWANINILAIAIDQSKCEKEIIES